MTSPMAEYVMTIVSLVPVAHMLGLHRLVLRLWERLVRGKRPCPSPVEPQQTAGGNTAELVGRLLTALPIGAAVHCQVPGGVQLTMWWPTPPISAAGEREDHGPW